MKCVFDDHAFYKAAEYLDKLHASPRENKFKEFQQVVLAPMFTELDRNHTDQSNLFYWINYHSYLYLHSFRVNTLAAMITVDYLLALIRTRPGSVFDTAPDDFVDTIRSIQHKLTLKPPERYWRNQQEPARIGKVDRFLISRTLEMCGEIFEFYQLLVTEKERTRNRTEQFKEELMRVTWHPSRAHYWMDPELAEELARF
jgi:hypothetical protein